jgi:hypothetical protein
LLHDGDLTVVPLGIEFFYVHSIKLDKTTLRVVESFNQSNDTAFTAATLATKSYHFLFTFNYIKGDSFKYLYVRLRWVIEAYIFK